MMLANAPLIKFEEDKLLPKLPTNDESELFFLEMLSWLQQWGVLACIVGAILCFIVSKLFKVKKNPKSQRVWRFYSYGLVFIAVTFAVLPYIALRFY